MTKYRRLTNLGATPATTDTVAVGTDDGTYDVTVAQLADAVVGSVGDVTGEAASIDNEIALFSGTGGKTIKRATTTGLLKATSGVIGAAASGTDYAPPTTGGSILKGNNAGGFDAAVQGSDYYKPDGTDVAVADGGTGASTAADARTNLGLAIGTHVQAYDAQLTELGNISPSQGDIIYYNGSNWTRLAAGTSGAYLKTLGAGANPTWATLTTGSVLYEAVVATSGGDYTTIGAAVSAGKTRIFVRNGTYVESNITFSDDTIIHGESRDGVVIDMNATSVFTFGASNIVENVSVTNWGTNAWQIGSDNVIRGCRFDVSGTSANTIIRFGGAVRFIIEGNHFYNTTLNVLSTGFMTDGTVTWGTGLITDNLFYGLFSTAILIKQGSIFHFTGNYLHSTATSGTAIVNIDASTNCHDSEIAGNLIICDTSASGLSPIRLNGMSQMIIRDNSVTCHAGTSAIKLLGSSYNLITGNYMPYGGTGVNLDGTSNKNNVTGNYLGHYAISNGISDSGLGNDLTNNGVTAPVNEKHHVLMKNTSGGALAAGDVVVLKAVAAGDEITTTTSAGDNKVYGMAIETINNTSYGYVQVLGKTTLLKVDGTTDIAIGDYLSCFTTAGIAQKASAGHMVFAMALEAYTANDSNGVIDALLITPRLI